MAVRKIRQEHEIPHSVHRVRTSSGGPLQGMPLLQNPRRTVREGHGEPQEIPLRSSPPQHGPLSRETHAERLREMVRGGRVMKKNGNLLKAKKAKNDEFYTQYEDIEREVSHYAE